MFGPISIQQVSAKHSRFESRFRILLETTTGEAARIAERHVYQTPHFKPRTGRLQRATKAKAVRTRSGRIVRVTNTAPYAQPIEYGARPHIIRARRARSLRFDWPKFWSVQTRSPTWFLRSVHHPGNRPYKFLWHATWGSYRFTGGQLRQGMQQLARHF
jgi:hypothetical protein